MAAFIHCGTGGKVSAIRILNLVNSYWLNTFQAFFRLFWIAQYLVMNCIIKRDEYIRSDGYKDRNINVSSAANICRYENLFLKSQIRILVEEWISEFIDQQCLLQFTFLILFWHRLREFNDHHFCLQFSFRLFFFKFTSEFLVVHDSPSTARMSLRNEVQLTIVNALFFSSKASFSCFVPYDLITFIQRYGQ